MAYLARVPQRISQAPRKLAAMPKRAGWPYKTAEWRALVKARKLDPDYAAAKARAGKGERLILDHVHEIRDGGAAFDPANTQWLTFGEHQRKTAKVKGERARGGGSMSAGSLAR